MTLFLQMTVDNWVMQFVLPWYNKRILAILVITTRACIFFYLSRYKSPNSSFWNLTKKTITVELLEFLVILQAIFVALLHSLFTVILNFTWETSQALMSFWHMEHVPYLKTTMKIWVNHQISSNKKISIRDNKLKKWLLTVMFPTPW